MRTVLLTLRQVEDIFNAGVKRGESEASAFEWGCRAAGRAKDDLIDALVDAINDQGHIHDVTFSEVSEWFDEIKEQQ